MKALHVQVLLCLLSAAQCSRDEGKNAFSSASASSITCEENCTDLRNRLEQLELKLVQIEKILLISEVNPETKSGVLQVLQEKSIEEDVQQNKEDIIDLRVNDGRHDMLIYSGMSQTNYINNTIIPGLESRIEVHINIIESALTPVGSIIAWLPAYKSAEADIPQGWKRCDGSIIKAGPFTGMATPDLNTAKRFLRGASDESAGQFEEDTVQDHLHVDPGHKHLDNGHTHYDTGHVHYEDADYHNSVFTGSSDENKKDVLCSRYLNGGDTGCAGWYFKFNDRKTETGRASISTDKASIQTSTTGISGMASGRIGDETRPKNMNVVYIMRIF